MNKTELLKEAASLIKDILNTTDDPSLKTNSSQWLIRYSLTDADTYLLREAKTIMQCLVNTTTDPGLKRIYQDWINDYEEVECE